MYKKLEDLKQEVKNISIESYLDSLGIKKEKKGPLVFFSSPFSSDSTPSLCVYPTNTFYDFSTGRGGDIIQLKREFNALNNVNMSFPELLRSFNDNMSDLPKFTPRKVKKKVKKFNLNKYISKDEKVNKIIDEYALKRGIKSDYIHILSPVYFNDRFYDVPSIGFIHKDLSGKVTGVKARFVDSYLDYPQEVMSQRFRAFGKLNIYTLDNCMEETNNHLFISESETSSNSLFQYMKENLISGAVLCFGGIGFDIKDFPAKFKNIKNKKVIIDYDGSEELYQERIAKYKDLGTPIKIELEKGEDINSLYVKKQLNKYHKTIFV